MTGTFGSFKSTSFYGGNSSSHFKNVFPSFSSNSYNIDQTTLKNDLKKTKKSKFTSLFSGVKHGIKKPKAKKVEANKISNTVDKIFTSNKKIKKAGKLKSACKENKPLKSLVVTPNKETKSNAKKSSNKNGGIVNEGFLYKYQTTPEQYRVKKVLPYIGFGGALSSSAKSGKKKLFSPEEDESDIYGHSSSKKMKSNQKKNSPRKKASPKKLFNKLENKETTPKCNKSSVTSNTSIIRSGHKTITCETIDLEDTPSPKHNMKQIVSKSKNPEKTEINLRKSPRKCNLKKSIESPTPKSDHTKSPKRTPRKIDNESPRKTPQKTTSDKYKDEPMIIDSPKIKSPMLIYLETIGLISPNTRTTSRRHKPNLPMPEIDSIHGLRSSPRLRNDPLSMESSIFKDSTENKTSEYAEASPVSTPRTTRSSVKKLSSNRDTPKRMLSSKKKLFPKESHASVTPVHGQYFEKDVSTEGFNVFDILNDSLDGIEVLEQDEILLKDNSLFKDVSMSVSKDWNSPTNESVILNSSVSHTFPKLIELENKQTLNTFPRVTRASRKSVQSLTPTHRSYGSACRKTLKTTFELSQLQLSSPNSKKCHVCGYTDDFEDADHAQLHSMVLRLKHYQWKNERVVEFYDNSSERVICVTNNDKMWLPKAVTVIEIADLELGFAETECAVTDKTKVYLYISKQTIVGLVVANQISQANRLISSSMNYSVDYASEELYPAACGISRIWVLRTYRRKRIATKLLDAVRASFIPDRIIKRNEIAFSVPTSDGKEFAAKYTGRNDFLIFTHVH